MVEFIEAGTRKSKCTVCSDFNLTTTGLPRSAVAMSTTAPSFLKLSYTMNADRQFVLPIQSDEKWPEASVTARGPYGTTESPGPCSFHWAEITAPPTGLPCESTIFPEIIGSMFEARST